MWDATDIVRTVRSGLAAASDATVREQAVHGIDALCEVDLHPLIAATFADAPFTTLREKHYPGDPAARRKYSARQRCDLVLLPGTGLTLRDPVAELIQKDQAVGTLFGASSGDAPPCAAAVAPEDAFWLEVKVVGQFCHTQGVPGPNRAYSSELTSSLYVDLAKINADAALKWSGLLLVLFTDSEETASHDLSIALHRSLDRGHTFRAPVSESFPIPDRIGNRTCMVSLIPR